MFHSYTYTWVSFGCLLLLLMLCCFCFCLCLLKHKLWKLWVKEEEDGEATRQTYYTFLMNFFFRSFKFVVFVLLVHSFMIMTVYGWNGKALERRRCGDGGASCCFLFLFSSVPFQGKWSFLSGSAAPIVTLWRKKFFVPSLFSVLLFFFTSFGFARPKYTFSTPCCCLDWLRQTSFVNAILLRVVFAFLLLCFIYKIQTDTIINFCCDFQ